MSRKTVMRMAIVFPLHVLLLLVVMGIHDSVSGSTIVEMIGLPISTIAAVVYCFILIGSLAWVANRVADDEGENGMEGRREGQR